MSKTKTYKYLYPCVHYGYGIKFQSMMSEFIKSGLVNNMFIGDVSQPDLSFAIFILFNKDKAKNFNLLLEWFSKEKAYVYDYEVSDKLHMIVANIPDEYTKAYDNFRNSKYSKMYSADFLNKYLNSAATIETYGVLAKTEKRAQYLRELVDTYELADEYDDILDSKETFDKNGI